MKPDFEETTGQKFLGIDTCTLRKAHVPIKKGVTKLPIDIDQFAVDLHRFFESPVARREDCSKMQDLTEITSNYVLRHSSVRCLTVILVLVRIIGYWENIKEYFCIFTPKQIEFKKLVKYKKDQKYW